MTTLDRLAALAEEHVRPNVIPASPGFPAHAGLGFHGGREAAVAILKALRNPDKATLEAATEYDEGWPEGKADALTHLELIIDHILSERP